MMDSVVKPGPATGRERALQASGRERALQATGREGALRAQGSLLIVLRI